MQQPDSGVPSCSPLHRGFYGGLAEMVGEESLVI